MRRRPALLKKLTRPARKGRRRARGKRIPNARISSAPPPPPRPKRRAHASRAPTAATVTSPDELMPVHHAPALTLCCEIEHTLWFVFSAGYQLRPTVIVNVTNTWEKKLWIECTMRLHTLWMVWTAASSINVSYGLLHGFVVIRSVLALRLLNRATALRFPQT